MYANLFQQLIGKYEAKVIQYLLCNSSGDLLLSNNSLIRLQARIGENLFRLFPVLEGLREEIMALSKERNQIFLPRIETNSPELKGIYDYTIEKIFFRDKNYLFVVIHDNTLHNHYWTQVQQERNDAIIAKEVAELKVYTEQLQGEVEKRTQELSEKNQRIQESIEYSKVIQKSILPEEHLLQNTYFEAFVLYQPKDIVSGDFYWLSEAGSEGCYIAVADCTGHGVPAAMLSVAGSLFLNEIVQSSEILSPAAILEALDQKVRKLFTHAHQSLSDGMEIGLLQLDYTRQTLSFAGARNKLIYFNQGEMFAFEGNRRAINGISASQKPFKNHYIPFEQGDMFYLYSDGYPDQFGGEKGQKFLQKNFIQCLKNIQHLPLYQQKYLLLKNFDTWKGAAEQTDDVLVLGLRML
jgi:serine phosphatase RsbU (regulator of sigma subunit)